AYVIRRLLLVIPTVIVVSMVVFSLVRLLPGDIIDIMMRHAGRGGEIDRAMMEFKLGLDAPALTQYGRWVGVVPQVDGSFSGIFQGNLGFSWWYKLPVGELAANAWPVTLELGLMSLIIAL
ncbi:unnamed protein product, partial [marine sediment metagenome]